MRLSTLGQKPKPLRPASGFPCVSGPSLPLFVVWQFPSRAWLLVGAVLGDRCVAGPAGAGNPLSEGLTLGECPRICATVPAFPLFDS